MKKYNTMYTVYHNDTIIDSKRSTVFSEKDLKSETIKINWDNVSDVFIFEVCVSRAFFGLQVPPVGFFYAI